LQKFFFFLQAEKVNFPKNLPNRSKDNKKAMPSLLFISGFLGAGKTTAISWMARNLAKAGKRVAIVANDQSDGLVDTQIAQLYATSAQVAGGCFCCRSSELVEILNKQTEETRPDVFLAEPVGSCTDLTATLIHPLREIYKLPLRIAPLTVFLDSRRAKAHFFGTGRRNGLAKEVGYIWQKQLEEAEVIVLNKVDLIPEGALERLKLKLALLQPKAMLFTASAANGKGMSRVLSALCDSESAAVATPEVDYQIYAKGEALLGWVNMEAHVQKTIAPDTVLLRLCNAVRKTLEAEGMDIAHFKMSFDPGDGQTLTVVNVTLNGEAARLSRKGIASAKGGKLLVNLRAEGDPDRLVQIVRRHTEKLAPEWQRCEAFRPSEPKPLHRIQKKAA
jgi:G3E family GTPase